MTTSTLIHRPAHFVAVAATGLAGLVLAATLTSAQASPERGDAPAVPAPTNGRYIERACFITPVHWNEGLDGPLPRCYTFVA